MQRSYRNLALAAACCFGLVGGCAVEELEGSGVTEEGRASVVSIDPVHLDFGTTPDGATREFEVTVTNDSNEPLILGRVELFGSPDFELVDVRDAQGNELVLAESGVDGSVIKLSVVYHPSDSSEDFGQLEIDFVQASGSVITASVDMNGNRVADSISHD